MKMERRKLVLYASLFVAGVVSLIFDSNLTSALPSIFNDNLERIFYTLSEVVYLLLILTAIVITSLVHKKTKNLLRLFIAGIFGFLGSYFLKFMFQRPRPFGMTHESFLLNLPDFSFPSSHAVAVFAMLPIVMQAYPKFRWFFITFACLVAFSRFYLGLHYLSDVIFGALIGLLISDFVMNATNLSKI